jgi:hypothetical protein
MIPNLNIIIHPRCYVTFIGTIVQGSIKEPLRQRGHGFHPHYSIYNLVLYIVPSAIRRAAPVMNQRRKYFDMHIQACMLV